MQRDIRGRHCPAAPAFQTIRRGTGAHKYVGPAVQGFLIGYLLVPCALSLLLFPFCWRVAFTPEGVAEMMRIVFFSPMQSLFFMLGAYFAATHAINAHESVRRSDRTVSWYEFIMAMRRRR